MRQIVLGLTVACCASVTIAFACGVLRCELEDKPKFFGDWCDIWLLAPSEQMVHGYQRKVIEGKTYYNIGLMGRRLPMFTVSTLLSVKAE